MFDAQVYVGRRNGLQRQFKHGLLLFVGNADSPMNYAANAYHFRQDSARSSTTGAWTTPTWWPSSTSTRAATTIYGDDFTVDDIVWRGPQPTIAERAARAGVTETAPLDQLPRLLSEAIRTGRRIHFLPQYRADNAQLLERLLGIRAEALNRARLGRAVQGRGVAAGRQERRGDRARSRRALEVSRDMHVLAMRMAKPGVYEREVAGAMEGLVASRGVATGLPGHLLGARRDAAQPLPRQPDGSRADGGERLGRRVAPALRRATSRARSRSAGASRGRSATSTRRCYRAQKKAIAAVKPGVRFRDVHLLACRSLADDLKAIGLHEGRTSTPRSSRGRTGCSSSAASAT